MRKKVPIKQDGRVVGEAVVEDTPEGVRMVSSTITDPVLLKILEADRLRGAASCIPFMTQKGKSNGRKP